MSLRFTNYRRLDRAGATRATGSPSASYVEAIRLTRGVARPADQVNPAAALVRPEDAGGILRKQFVACARVFGAIDDDVELTFEDLFTSKLAKIDRTGSFADDFEAANIEWWDVEDEGRVMYELLFMGPGYGKLMVAGTAQFIGYVNQYDLYSEEEPNPRATLWRALALAQTEAKALYPESELAELAVPSR